LGDLGGRVVAPVAGVLVADGARVFDAPRSLQAQSASVAKTTTGQPLRMNGFIP